MPRSRDLKILQNSLAALTTSIVALTLGAALGMLSGRGAFAGMISAAIFPIIACAFGGTRVKVSGPTAPMSAMMAVIVAHMASDPSLSDAFVSTVLYESAILLVLLGLFRTGRFIDLVPRVVVSGFMTGIGILVWMSQEKVIIGPDITMPNWQSICLSALTLVIIFVSPKLLKRVPGTLTAMVAVTTIYVAFPDWFPNAAAVGALKGGSFSIFVPDLRPLSLLMALPYAIELAFLCYLDTLLTSLVIDMVMKEKTKRDQELGAQGLATFAVALIGGIPGAQATIRSYMIVKEGATERFAGVLVGVFVLVELFILKSFIAIMPKALFAGILLKVGYDVIDWEPLKLYVRRYWWRQRTLAERSSVPDVIEAARSNDMFVGHLEAFLILATTAITVLVDLNIAVFIFTVVFFAFRIFHIILDMKPYELITSDLIAVATFRGELTFERMKNLHNMLEKSEDSKIAVLDMGRVEDIDETGALAFKSTIGWLREHNKTPLVAALSRKVKEVLIPMGILKDVGQLNIFRTVDRALIYADHLLEKIRDEEAGLDSFLPKELIFLDVDVRNKSHLFETIADKAFDAGYVLHRDSFYHDLVVSEEKGSTGLEKGIAMPHCRSQQVLDTFVMYLRPKYSLSDYAALDGKPISHVFVIGGTEELKVYLKVMAKIASVIHEADAFEQLERAKDLGTVYRAIVGRDLKVFDHEADV